MEVKQAYVCSPKAVLKQKCHLPSPPKPPVAAPLRLDVMRSSKWLVFVRPALAGFDRSLTVKSSRRLSAVAERRWKLARHSVPCAGGKNENVLKGQGKSRRPFRTLEFVGR
jgi:hypothetical protein